jgi:hypothetical protein
VGLAGLSIVHGTSDVSLPRPWASPVAQEMCSWLTVGLALESRIVPQLCGCLWRDRVTRYQCRICSEPSSASPSIRGDRVLHPRLADRLNAGLGRKLTLISAPAGYRKTSLASTNRLIVEGAPRSTSIHCGARSAALRQDVRLKTTTPPGNHVGGEAREAVYTKCDLDIQPSGESGADVVVLLDAGSSLSVLAMVEGPLQSGHPATRVEIDGLGRSNQVVVENGHRVVLMTCLGGLSLFDTIAHTLDRDY